MFGYIVGETNIDLYSNITVVYMKLSIIIISFNARDVLDNCIASIKSSNTKCSYEIIVVDNNSHDDSVAMLEEKYPEVKLVKNQDNKLFAIANNQGAELASGEYLFLLNSDTIVYGDNIDKLVDYFDALDKDVICIGPKILNSDKTLQSQGMYGFSLWNSFCFWFKLERILPNFIGKKILPPATYTWNYDIPHEVGWVSGCAMLIRRKEYIELGGLNEKLEFYGEEPEFSFRAKKKAYLTYYYPHAEIIHLGGVATKVTSKPNKTTAEKQILALRRYSKLVGLTVGYRQAIWMARVTKWSYICKWPFVKNKEFVSERISNENRVIAHFKEMLK